MKYEEGDRVSTLCEAIDRIEKRKPFYHRHKFMAAGFIEHWSIVQITAAAKSGRLRSAVRIERINK